MRRRPRTEPCREASFKRSAEKEELAIETKKQMKRAECHIAKGREFLRTE